MMSRFEIENKLHEIKPVLIDKFHVSKIGYFGSYANGQQTNNSDVDLLVEFFTTCRLGIFYIRKIPITGSESFCGLSNKKCFKGTN